jgi:putative hydrolase of HD superfamily
MHDPDPAAGLVLTDPEHEPGLVAAVVNLGRLALAFGRIDRTACYHPDGATRESDSDHTVMLGWLAPALATRWLPQLDVGLVAQFALIHDMPEVYAGDTPTLRISDEGRAAKAEREAAAVDRLRGEFGYHLWWVTNTLDRYEAQVEPEARFVRGLDKCLPKIVHLLDGAAGLREERMGSTELAGVFARQEADMARYVGEFTDLMDLRAELVRQVVALVAESETASA